MPGNYLAGPRKLNNEVLVEGEFALNWRDFRRISAIMRSETGVDLQPAKALLVYSRLVKRIRALRLCSFASYLDFVSSSNGCNERRQMCNALTTNVTRFFREPHHFEHLRLVALPHLLSKIRQGAPVRIWSSACSSGEEPYSVALTILNFLPNGRKHDVRILATDINSEKVSFGQRGTYSAADLEPIPRDMRQRYFYPINSARTLFEVHKDVKSMVTFRELNLNGPWPAGEPFDIIFCRNVVIYFDEVTRNQLWQRLAKSITSGGFLYLGHSERISGPAANCFDCVDTTTYKRLSRSLS